MGKIQLAMRKTELREGGGIFSDGYLYVKIFTWVRSPPSRAALQPTPLISTAR